MSSSPPNDRRDQTRVPIELRVEYKRLNTFFSDYTKNISKGGTFIATDQPLAIGTEFSFSLTIPSRPEPLRLIGKVMWVTTSANESPGKPPGMGIEFQYPTSSDRHQVEVWVERVMVEELGLEITEGLLGRAART